jgi:hypothetical protein
MLVLEKFKITLLYVYWFVMSDDDTVFFLENMLQVLSKYEHSSNLSFPNHSKDLGMGK